nr:glycohydrolase toxin TNT-related protein [Saccharothrix obliqua]
MSEPKPLNPTEQDALVKQIGLSLMRAAPEDWRHVTAEYRATGRYFELSAEVRAADGTMRAWSPPQDVAGLFARLRAGMYREGRGSWSNARYQLDHPSSYNLDFDRAEPVWQTPPPPQAYVDEMRFFPRTDENVPDWLRRRLAQQPAQPRFRTARVFDGAGPNGRPSAHRPPVPDDERERLLAYLDHAPVAVVGRGGFDADVLNPEAPAVVPVAFQTDGHWIWPAAVGYYLRAYGVPPEPELVERVKAHDFELPEVPEDVRVAAAANLGAPAAPRDTPLPAVPVHEFREYEEPVEVGETVAALLPDRASAEDGPVPVGETVHLGDVKPETVEYAQDGPPYRVRFEEDGGPVVEDRYRRDTYVDGMDLFAPVTTYDRAPEEAQTWSPFADEEPEAARAAEPETEAEPEPVDESPAEPEAVEAPAADEPERVVDEEEAERTTEIEVDQEELFPEQSYDRGHRFDEHDSDESDHTDYDDTADYEEPAEEEPRQVTVDEERELVALRRALDDLEVPAAAYRFGEPVDRTWRLRVTDRDWEVSWYDHGPTKPVHFEHLDDAAAYLVGKLVLTGHRAPRPLPPRNQPPRPPRPEGFREEPHHEPFRDEPRRPEPFRDERAPEPLPEEPPRRPEQFHDEPPRPPEQFHDEAQRDEVQRQPEPFRDEPRQPEPFRDDVQRQPEQYRDDVQRQPEPFREDLQRQPENFRDEPRRPEPFREEHQAQAEGFREEPPRPPLNNGFRDDRRAPTPPPAPPRAEAQEPPKSRAWPITPMNGEPPLTLFRHKQLVELPVGAEVDRFGDGGGNLVYAAGTPFPERSLVPSWVNRPYRVYRLRRPLEVLTGIAVPWFEQPGGGTAYLLPGSVDDMLADGVLVEVANQEAPTH